MSGARSPLGENALYTADLLNHSLVREVLLTSDFHVYRSVRAFQKVGLPVLPRFFLRVFKRTVVGRIAGLCFADLCIETAKIVSLSYQWLDDWPPMLIVTNFRSFPPTWTASSGESGQEAPRRSPTATSS